VTRPIGRLPRQRRGRHPLPDAERDHAFAIAYQGASVSYSRQPTEFERDECLLAAFEQALSQGCARVRAAYEAEASWVDAVRAGTRALLSCLEDESQLARLYAVEVLAASPRGCARLKQMLDTAAEALDAGGRSTRAWPSPLAAEGIVGGIFAVILARLLEPAPAALAELVSPLTAMIVLPYRGVAAANRELARSARGD
jgi:hypothetical protein